LRSRVGLDVILPLSEIELRLYSPYPTQRQMPVRVKSDKKTDFIKTG